VLFDGQLLKILRDGIDKGRWTLEDLDSPGPHTIANCQGAHYRNPLRDPPPVEAVQVSDPRDFTPNPGSTPANAPPLPLTLDQPELPPFDADSLDF